jgi:hypothetical protein
VKKNKVACLTSALLVLTLLTTCAISGTFAKYVTKTEGADGARVAYWGFDQPAELEFDLFDAEYDGTVKSANGDNIVAPGTSKSTIVAFHYTDNGKKGITAPEVDYRFTIDVDTYGSTIELDANKSFKWTLERHDGFVEEFQTLDELVKAVESLAGTVTGSQVYEAGTLPEQFTHDNEIPNSVKIGWKWDYEKLGVTKEEIAIQDMRDTAMGSAQALDNVHIAITITAEQVD